MAYKNRYGITNIKPFTKHGFDCLDISFEADNGMSDQRELPKWDPTKCHPVFLWTPKKDGYDHDHIILNRTQAKRLHQWLTEYLDDCDKMVAPAKPKNKITIKSLKGYVS